MNRVCIFEPESESKVDDVLETQAGKQADGPIYNVEVAKSINKKVKKPIRISSNSEQKEPKLKNHRKQLKIQKILPRPWSS